jgi:hypothetical protein
VDQSEPGPAAVALLQRAQYPDAGKQGTSFIIIAGAFQVFGAETAQPSYRPGDPRRLWPKMIECWPRARTTNR